MTGFSSLKGALFRERLLAWWSENRRRFPWREGATFYKTFLAELLLRKTTARQVESAYQELERRWPDLCLLGKANPLEVEEVIKPLGIHKKRSLLLVSAAESLCRRLGPNPDCGTLSLEDLRGIPGLGRYASNMILSVCAGKPLPGLDTNFIRIIERVFGVRSSKVRPHTDPQLWEFAQKLVPEESPGAFNWAIADFGALVCTKKKPKCVACPVKDLCLFYSSQAGP